MKGGAPWPHPTPQLLLNLLIILQSFMQIPRVCSVQHREQVLKLHPNIEEFLTHIGGASCQIFTTKILSVHQKRGD